MSFLKSIKNDLGNEFASVADEGLVGEVTGWIDTGSYMLNAILSGSIHRGFPDNKIMQIGGDPGAGKTFFVFGLIQDFLKNNPDGNVVYFESEGALSDEMFTSRDLDKSRILIVPVSTVQQFRTASAKVVESYKKLQDRPKMMFVLDSLGMLSTEKELEDAKSGSDARDMTRAQLIRGAFRVLSLDLGALKIPMIVTNHVGFKIGAYVPTKVFGGGEGLNYAASISLMLSKSKDKVGTDVVGNIVKINLAKSRFSRENTICECRVSFDSGLDRYYGLTDFAIDQGVFVKDGNMVRIGDKKVWPKTINENPQEYFTPEVLEQIDQAAHKAFMFGSWADTSFIEKV